MKYIKQIIVGNSECPIDPLSVKDQIIQATKHALEDNEYYEWGIKYFSIGLFDGELWLVGYTDDTE